MIIPVKVRLSDAGYCDSGCPNFTYKQSAKRSNRLWYRFMCVQYGKLGRKLEFKCPRHEQCIKDYGY